MIDELKELGFDKNLNDGCDKFMKAKQKKWLEAGETLYCLNDENNSISIKLDDNGERIVTKI